MFSRYVFPFRLVSAGSMIYGLMGLFVGPCLAADVVFSEIMYHPIEEPAFDAQGQPLVALYEDVYEFVELHNPGPDAQSLAGWQIAGGIRFRFSEDAVIEPGEYRVIAKDPDRLAAVDVYNLGRERVWGPYAGTLSNRGERIRLLDGADDVVDQVEYSDQHPWPISADALGIGQRWTGQDPMDRQYRGRSLERVSWQHRGNDAANWVASPPDGEPSPGAANHIERREPKPIVTQCVVAPRAGKNRVIAPGQTTRIEVAFSSDSNLGACTLEYFVEDINSTEETVYRLELVPIPDAVGNRYAVVLPGQSHRSVVRYRVWAERGEGMERVYPRVDDPMEWHAYFVSEERESEHPIYDVFVSRDNLRTLQNNIQASPRRVTRPNPPGMPREAWNATEPAIFVHDGVVYDVHIRHHGSRYRRSVGRQSYKVLFPAYQLFREHDSVFLTDKDFATSSGHLLFRLAGLPTSETRTIDLRLNSNRRRLRLEQEEYNQCMLERHYRELPIRSPERPVLLPGALFKCVGNLNGESEGPFGVGDGTLLSAVTPRRQPEPIYWTPRQRYEHTFRIQNQSWLGHGGFQEMIEGLWAAREAENSVEALRVYFTEHWDIEDTLTYLAMINWMAPWDDVTHNYFLWQKRDGRWSMLPWDFDALFGGNSNSSASILTARNFQSRLNIFKDSFLKAFPDEFKRRIWELNNTLLHPENLVRMDLGRTVHSFSRSRFSTVNRQADQGEYLRPKTPSNLFPVGGVGISALHRLESSLYEAHSNSVATHHETLWEIRSEGGTFELPVFRQTSSDNLTSIAVPAEALKPGSRYFWRCYHVDSDGFRSLYSNESSFVFGAGDDVLPLITEATQWRYDDRGENLGTAWRREGFEDLSWPMAGGRFDETGGAGTTRLQSSPRTYYFRTTVALDGLEGSKRLLLSWEVADGAILYLNGRELYRTRISRVRPVRSSTFAEREVPVGTVDGPVELPAELLQSGMNTVAIELHRSEVESSMVSFSCSLQLIRTSSGEGLRLSELMAANGEVVPYQGEFPDWIELFNDSPHPANLARFGLSDDLAQLDKYRFPNGSRLEGGARVVVWCVPGGGADSFHAGFGLDRDGEELLLIEWDGEVPLIRDRVRFGPQLGDSTLSRHDVDRTWSLGWPSPGEPNVRRELGALENVRINEWTAGDAMGVDWVELVNPGDLAIDLGNCYLSDQYSNRQRFQIAPHSYLGPGGFVVFSSDPIDVRYQPLPFRLERSGEVFLVSDPVGRLIDQVGWSAQTEPIINGRIPNGWGFVQSNLIPTPGARNVLNTDRDGDGIPDADEARYGLDPDVGGDAVLDLDRDGVSNIDEYLAGTDPSDSASRLVIRSVHYSEDDSGPVIELVFEGVLGRSYSLQQNLVTDTGGWASVLQIPRLASSGEARVTFRPDPVGAIGFLRLVTPQVP